MDERLEKAFQVANYMATLTNQKRIIKEEFDQKSVYYINGGTFKITRELISFTKSIVDLGHTDDVVFLDVNHMPVVVADVQNFLTEIINTYFEALNEYSAKVTEIKTKRRLTDIVSL